MPNPEPQTVGRRHGRPPAARRERLILADHPLGGLRSLGRQRRQRRLGPENSARGRVESKTAFVLPVLPDQSPKQRILSGNSRGCQERGTACEESPPAKPGKLLVAIRHNSLGSTPRGLRKWRGRSLPGLSKGVARSEERRVG